MIIRPLAVFAFAFAFAFACACASSPVAAQDIDIEDTVFAGDYLSVGIGAAINPSYSGSDDYVISALPIVRGSLGGIGIKPRAAGLTLDFIEDADEGPGFDLGIAARLRSDRATQIEDTVVASLGKLDRAIEVGPSVGVSFSQVLNPYDSLSFGTDVMWDVNGAHGGMVVAPSVTYFTPLSRAMAANFTLSTEYADADFQDYYLRVTPSQSLATGGELPAFEPKGGGFRSAGATLLLAYDLDGDIANGGLGLVVVGGYSRVLGDTANTPFTSVRGTKNQFIGGLGIGYTF